DRRRSFTIAVGAAAEHRPDTRSQLAKTERLGDVIVRADVETRNAIALRRARRQHDDRDLGGFGAATHDAADLYPAQHRQIQIKNDKVGQLLGDGLERGVATSRDFHFDRRFTFERVFDESGDILFVLDDEHARSSCFHSVSPEDTVVNGRFRWVTKALNVSFKFNVSVDTAWWALFAFC